MFLLKHIKTGTQAGILLSALLLSGCEIDLSDDKKAEGGEAPQALMLSGSVADAAAVANAEVWIADQSGHSISQKTDASGEFEADVSSLQPPLLVGAQFSRDGATITWYSLVNNSSYHGTVAVNPLTTTVLAYETLQAYGVLDEVNAAAPQTSVVGLRLNSVAIPQQPLGDGISGPLDTSGINVSLPAVETAQEKFQKLLDAGVFERQGEQVALDQNLTRQQFAAIATRLAGLQTTPPASSPFEPLLGQHWFTAAIAQSASLIAPVGSVFTPNLTAQTALQTLLQRTRDMALNLQFNAAGAATAAFTAQVLNAQEQWQALSTNLMNLQQRLAYERSQPVQAFLMDLPDSLNSFRLYRPSEWRYSIKGSVTGDFSAPNFDEAGSIHIRGTGTLPLNENQLKQFLQDEIRKQLEYYGGNFSFNNIELKATGSGVAGSMLEGKASGVVSAKIATVAKSAHFTITELKLTRMPPP